MKENNFINSDKIYLFHNNRCSKSREVKKYLDDNNIIYEVIDYLNILPEESFLQSVLSKLENNFQEIIRVNEKIFKNLNMKIKKNKFYGLQGITGAGKSTFVDLYSGLLKDYDGDILVDNKLLSDENNKLWQKNISYVP